MQHGREERRVQTSRTAMSARPEKPAPPEAGSAIHRMAHVWVPILGTILLMAVAVRLTAQPIRDPDAWWHLRVGALLWDGTITLRDTQALSSFATEEWTPRDWIPQLAASKAEEWFGLPGVAWLHGAAFIFLIGALYFACRRQSSPLPSLVASFLCILGASSSLTQRPQMLSFIFLSIFVDAWLRTARDSKPRWWLIVISWIWANSHGMWYFGVAVGIAVCLGLAMDRKTAFSQVVRLCLVPTACLGVAALTPGGVDQLWAAFTTAGKWSYVTEWAPTNFATPSAAVALGMVVIVAVAAARRTVPTSWVTIGLLLLGLILIVMSGRTVAPGAIILAPLAAKTLQEVMSQVSPLRITVTEVTTITTGAAVSLLWLAVLVPETSSRPGDVPITLDSQLEDLTAGTPILNEYGLGGWLHWRHPQLDTVIDGFTDGYSVEAIERYVSARRLDPGWQAYVRWTNADVALLADESPLAAALVDQLRWREVASADGYVLLRSSP